MQQNETPLKMSKEAFVLESVSLAPLYRCGFTLKWAGHHGKEYDISRTTMYHALKNLEKDGYLSCTRKSWYPTEKLRKLFYPT
jgi:DNA-binding PadR family transcriptional regulator